MTGPIRWGDPLDTIGDPPDEHDGLIDHHVMEGAVSDVVPWPAEPPVAPIPRDLPPYPV